MKALLKYIDAIFIYIFFLVFYLLIEKLDIFTDIELHALLLTKINTGYAYPGNPILYYIINFFTFCSTDMDTLILAYNFFIPALIVAKYLLTKHFLRNYFSSNLLLILFSISLLFVFCLPDPFIIESHRYYIGRFTANIWHNPTIIALGPMALILFDRQIKSLKNPENFKYILQISVIILLSTLIKPSLTFIYLPTAFIFILLKFGINKILFKQFIPLVVATLTILGQFIYIYLFGLGNHQDTESGVAIASFPFEAFSFYFSVTSFIVMFLGSSLLFIVFVYLYRAKYFKNILDNYRQNKHLDIYLSIGLLLMSLIVSAVLKETGARQMDLNFYWQNMLSFYILFMVIVKYSFGDIVHLVWQKLTKSQKILLPIYTLYVFSGVLYLVKIIVIKSYA
jgi:hypothetical protein